MFRKLRADEIDVRVSTVKDNGMSLLLYKDARCDMNILDETVGPSRWQRDHKEIKGTVYAGVSIFDDNLGWVTKWDAGSESYTEKEKGEASDSFKRACFNWGIGRELYTAPFIWVTGYDKYEKFSVKSIDYTDDKITSLVIIDKSGNVAFSMNYQSKPKNEPVRQEASNPYSSTHETQNAVRSESRASERYINDSIIDELQELERKQMESNHITKTIGGNYACNKCDDGILEPQYWKGEPYTTKDGSKWKHVCSVCGHYEYIPIEDIK